jgi:hypothetical protein
VTAAVPPPFWKRGLPPFGDFHDPLPAFVTESPPGACNFGCTQKGLWYNNRVGSIAFAIVLFNLLLIGFMAVIYFRGSVPDDRRADLEEFCASIPRNARIPDPCILREGKWLRRTDPDYPHSA